ncbi:hypothetical protein ACKVMT_12100 [Halobacteriales archaeon Cl-PHB]
MEETVALVERSLTEEAAAAFMDRVEDQADWLRQAITAGEMDNHDFAVGMEMEVYAVESATAGQGPCGETDGWRGCLAPIPDAVFEDPAAAKELGLHNVEVNTDPSVLSEAGLAEQAAAIERRTAAAKEAATEQGVDLVLDAMWTIPPVGGSRDYLADVDERSGVTLARNMRQDPRYVAIDNDALRQAGGDIPFTVPGADLTFPTILFESLATSIQPHLQIPSAEAFPHYYNVAIRTLGPLLALATNSPFLPADFYDEDAVDGRALVPATHHELRIAAFEQSVNHTDHDKVRVPEDITATTEVVDRVVEDDLYAPFLREWIEGDADRESLGDEVWEFDYKRGTYWRWLRCVVGGDPVDGAGDEQSLRIEYRPLPTQPTVRDVVGLQAVTAGLIRGLVEAHHPIESLPWADAEASFYAAAEDGLEADLAWVSAEGEQTRDPAIIFGEVFAYAREGLAAAGIPEDDVDSYLAPIEARWNAGVTPSMWKKGRVREGLEEGLGLRHAIEEMQREYVELAEETESFADWL